MGHPAIAEMDIKVRKRVWRGWYWVALIPMVVGASLTLLRYAGWSAVYSGNYGLPSATNLVKEAYAKATTDFWLLSGLSVASAGTVTACIWPAHDEPCDVSSLLPRVIFAIALVLALIVLVAIGLLFAGRLLK
jgi:hypothetical protein